MVASLRLVQGDAPAPVGVAVSFADFWALYPRRVARKAAAAAWARVPEAQHVTVIESLYDWRRVWLSWGDLHYVPHAATWLNGERWDDELPPGYARPAQRALQHAAPQEAPRREMSSAVREALERLRAGLR